MLNSKELNYFGKLRRRREFLKSGTLSEELYNFWELWFSKCSRQNSFLPFLDSRSKSEHPIWLFVISDQDYIKIGLTVMSSDMSERRFPFVLYYNLNKMYIKDKECLMKNIEYLACRYIKFKKIASIGNFETTDIETFESKVDNNELSSDLIAILDNITEHVLNEHDPSLTYSYWTNLNTNSFLQHDGAFTCALYNKIYG